MRNIVINFAIHTLMYSLSLIFCKPFTDIIMLILGLYMFSINKCVNHQEQNRYTWQDASLQSCLTNYTNFYLQNQMHLSTCLTYILSLSIFYFIMYNPVIVIGTNYFVLWNDVHITI